MSVDAETRTDRARQVVAPPQHRQHSTRVVVAGRDVLLRTGLAALLEQRADHRVIGTAGDATELLELVGRQDADLVVMEAGLPPDPSSDGLEVAARLRSEHPRTAVVVLATNVTLGPSAGLLANGQGFGYLLRHRVVDVDDFVDTVRRVLRGGCVLDPLLVLELVRTRDHDDPLARLSRRELDVLELMARGRSNLGVARELWLAEGTVEKHVRSILTKLGLCDTPTDHRRVLAVIAFLHAGAAHRGVSLSDASA